MEFLNFKIIRTKLKKRGILFKKPNIEDATYQLSLLARQLEDDKLYSGFCHWAIATCQNNAKSPDQVGSLLNAARSYAQARHEIFSREDHIQLVSWIYTEALLICDRSFIRPIRLELGRFYESQGLNEQAAECFKQSMSISRCVHNLIFAKRYKSALEELKNCPSHIMTRSDHISMFLLELLLNEDPEELNRNSLHQLSEDSRAITNRGPLPVDDHLYDLAGLLESLLILQKESRSSKKQRNLDKVLLKDQMIRSLIVDKLSAYLNPAQIQILRLIRPQTQYP